MPSAIPVTPVDSLVEAVRIDDVASARRLLEAHGDLRDVLDDPLPGLAFGSTLLSLPAQSGNQEMIDLLLHFGADIRVKSHWWAGGFGVLDVCSPDFAPFLIERGAVLTAYSASRLGRLDDLHRIVAENPSAVHDRGGDGQTPLHVASTAEVARFLVEHGAELDVLDVDHESTPIQYAIRDRQDVARYLADRGCRMDILAAAALGDGDRVRAFLDTNPESIGVRVTREFFSMRDPRAGGCIYTWTLGAGKTAHAIAKEFGHDDVFRLLMTRTPPALALAVACELEDEASVERVLRESPEIAASWSAVDHALIVIAAEQNKTHVVKLMLTAGWPAGAQRPGGASTLHFAAWHGNVEMVRALIAAGAPLDLADGQYGATPLGWAIHGSRNAWSRTSGDYAATVDALLSAGARAVSVDDSDGSEEAVRALRGSRRSRTDID